MKQWEYRERARQVLARETGYVLKPHGGRLRVALAFPNTYWVGMSSLGFQTVYRLFNDLDDVVCERVFLPPKQELRAQLASGTPLLTLETQTPVSDFDVLAFSVSFEWDYTNVVTMLRLAGMAPKAQARRARDPLVVIGGAVTFVNPEPLAPFADVIAAGEGEMLVPDLVTVLREGLDRDEQAARLATYRGFYVPSLYEVHYNGDGTIAGFEPRAGQRRASGGQEGRGQERGSARPAGDLDLHARHGVRIALPHRGRARVREPVPLLLGRVQLPAGARVSRRPHPGAGGGRAAVRRTAPASCRSRSATIPRSTGFSTACSRSATRSARPRSASTT